MRLRMPCKGESCLSVASSSTSPLTLGVHLLSDNSYQTLVKQLEIAWVKMSWMLLIKNAMNN